MEGYAFDFEAGDVSLDFCNTVNWHASEKPEERLTRYADLIAWGEEAGLVPPESASRLRQLELEAQEKTAWAYRAAIQLREALYHVFRSHSAGKPIPETDLRRLNAFAREAMAHLQLNPQGEGFRWDWTADVEGIDLILWPVARAAAELLTSGKAARIRECEDDRGCGYLFIDQSKNHSRRWCSMESCGNRAKARRHHLKTLAG